MLVTGMVLTAPLRTLVQVHALQVALNKHGYQCGDDDTVWWQFGMDTQSSLLTFQVMIGNTSGKQSTSKGCNPVVNWH